MKFIIGRGQAERRKPRIWPTPDLQKVYYVVKAKLELTSEELKVLRDIGYLEQNYPVAIPKEEEEGTEAQAIHINEFIKGTETRFLSSRPAQEFANNIKANCEFLKRIILAELEWRGGREDLYEL